MTFITIKGLSTLKKKKFCAWKTFSPIDAGKSLASAFTHNALTIPWYLNSGSLAGSSRQVRASNQDGGRKHKIMT